MVTKTGGGRIASGRSGAGALGRSFARVAWPPSRGNAANGVNHNDRVDGVHHLWRRPIRPFGSLAAGIRWERVRDTAKFFGLVQRQCYQIRRWLQHPHPVPTPRAPGRRSPGVWAAMMQPRGSVGRRRAVAAGSRRGERRPKTPVFAFLFSEWIAQAKKNHHQIRKIETLSPEDNNC